MVNDGKSIYMDVTSVFPPQGDIGGIQYDNGYHHLTRIDFHSGSERVFDAALTCKCGSPREIELYRYLVLHPYHSAFGRTLHWIRPKLLRPKPRDLGANESILGSR